jgi:cytochrome c
MVKSNRRVHLMKHVQAGLALFCMALCAFGNVASLAAGNADDAPLGKAVLEKHCARCHSVEKSGASSLREAPPLREVYLQYPIERLEFELAEGIGSRHQDMPQVQFSTEEISAIIEYLSSISDAK